MGKTYIHKNPAQYIIITVYFFEESIWSQNVTKMKDRKRPLRMLCQQGIKNKTKPTRRFYKKYYARSAQLLQLNF